EERQLVEVKSSELRRDQVGVVTHVSEAGLRRDRELRRVVQPRIEEGSLAMHLEVRDEGVPVRHRAPSGPGVQVDTGQAEGGWDERRGVLAVGAQRLSVQED